MNPPWLEQWKGRAPDVQMTMSHRVASHKGVVNEATGHRPLSGLGVDLLHDPRVSPILNAHHRRSGTLTTRTTPTLPNWRSALHCSATAMQRQPARLRFPPPRRDGARLCVCGFAAAAAGRWESGREAGANGPAPAPPADIIHASSGG